MILQIYVYACFQSRVLLPSARKEKTHCSTAAVCSLRCIGTSSGAKSIMARIMEDTQIKVFEATSKEELVKWVQSLQFFPLLSKALSVKAGTKPGCVGQSLSDIMYLTLTQQEGNC